MRIPSWKDKIRLLFVSGVVGLALLLLGISLREYVPLPREWRFFVGASLVYTVTACYLLFHARSYPESRGKWLRIAVDGFLLELPVIVLLLVFYAGLIPMPESMLPYVLGILVVAPVMSEALLRAKRRG